MTTTTAAHRASDRSEDDIAIVDSSAERRRAAGLLSIIGALVMACGGVMFTFADADLWGLVDGDVRANTYLADAAASVSTLHAAHTLWIAGVIVLAVGGVLLTGRGDDAASTSARVTYTIGAALAVPAFMAMVALTRLAETGADAPALAEALAFMGARLDDVATTVIMGLGPLLITVANRGDWMPRWLSALGVACAAAGLLSLISLFFGQADTLGFLVVPMGLVWTIAAGIVAMRQR